MQAGLKTTCQVLTKTRNRATVPVLMAGMRSSSPPVRAAILLAAVRRHDSLTHTQLLRHFAELDETDQAHVCDAHRTMPHHAAPVLRKALLEGDATMCANACEIILAAGDFNLFPTLLKAVENKKHQCTANILGTISGLVDHLYQELAQWASGMRTGQRDPSFARHPVLHALEQSLGRYAQHQRVEILDAFLLLAPVDNVTFLKILRDSTHSCHDAMVAALATSEDSAVMERLVDLMRDTDAPTAALGVVAKRSDQQFLNILLHELKHPAPLRVLHNMKRLRHVVWLESQRDLLLELDARAQAVAVELATASDLSRDALLEVLALVLRGGLAEGRRASCQSLAKFDDRRADELVLAALNDPDAGVQAAAIRQLRPRRLPDALKRLVHSLNSHSIEVRDAARTSLAEFNYVRYRAMFDLLDEESAKTTGLLVHKVDHSAIHKLVEDLNSPSVSTRLRGIEMAVAMAATDEVQPQLIELSHHENVAVRKEAVIAIGSCSNPTAVKALEFASRDTNGSVADAARICLSRHQLSSSRTATEQISTAGPKK